VCSSKKVSKIERNPISVLKEIIKEIIKINDEEKKASVQIIEKVGYIMKSYFKFVEISCSGKWQCSANACLSLNCRV
jgi:hypothetical protein